ncbi:MAG: ABC transporter permease [Lachnospiraceae bacterium]|nr:ABC transporter permease [Lachnospiraceae bacterium]
MKLDKKKKEPFIHITKRKDISLRQEWTIRLAGILLALIVCAVLTTIMTQLNPVSVYATMFEGSFGSERKVWALLKELSLLVLVAVALAPSFKMRFWNLGGEGQVLAGVLATSACMITLGGRIGNGLLILVSLVAALAAGALWAFIPAFFKAKWNTNETLFTLMMNYVATQIVAYFIIRWESPKGSGKVGVINADSEAGWLPVIAGKQYLPVAIVAVLVIAFMYVYLKYSKHGYELTVVGESQKTARYVGINVGKVIIRTLLLTGLICGLTGWMLVSSTDHTITTTLAGGRGFLGVMVAWLAHFNPVGMILSGFLIVFMSKGASEISMAYRLNRSFGDIITGVILFFVIGSEFFINYQIHFRKSSGKENRHA